MKKSDWYKYKYKKRRVTNDNLANAYDREQKDTKQEAVVLEMYICATDEQKSHNCIMTLRHLSFIYTHNWFPEL